MTTYRNIDTGELSVTVDGSHNDTVLKRHLRWEAIDPAADVPSTEAAGPASEVPDGSQAVVLAWVGDDPSRAWNALVDEKAKAKPRKGLVAALEAFAQEPAEPADPDADVPPPAAEGADA